MGKTRLIDLTGKRFERLTVIKRVENNKWGDTCYLCKCDCGNEIIATYGKLAYKKTKSCGCYATDMLIKNVSKHHLRNTRIYNIWANIPRRKNKNESSR